MNEDTYLGDDGLMYCKKCQKAREKIITSKVLNYRHKVRVMCACEKAEYEREEAERLERQRQSMILHNRSVCFHEKRMLELNFGNDDGTVSAMKYAREYVKNWEKVCAEHIGLMLWGGVGTGKTFMAAAIANALLDEGRKVKMTDFAEISNISVFDSVEYVKYLISYDLLIIDDLGSERTTEFAMQNVFDVVNRRWESGKPMIVTTNLTLDEVKELQGDNMMKRRIYDRVLDMCKPILVSGKSKREESGKQKMKLLKEIFSNVSKDEGGEADE